MHCEMCGVQGAEFKANVEGAILTVCQNCSKYGKVLEKVKPVQIIKKRAVKRQMRRPEETVFIIGPGFSKKISKKRQQKGLTQKEFAHKINERESLISKIESGAFEPSIKLSRKIEKFLDIRLIEEHTEQAKLPTKTKSSVITIGDSIKFRKR